MDVLQRTKYSRLRAYTRDVDTRAATDLERPGRGGDNSDWPRMKLDIWNPINSRIAELSHTSEATSRNLPVSSISLLFLFWQLNMGISVRQPSVRIIGQAGLRAVVRVSCTHNTEAVMLEL